MTLRCGCPYNLGDICKHEAAALFRLQDMAEKNMLGGTDIEYNQYHTVIRMKIIDLKMIRMLSSPAIYEEAENMLRSTKANITPARDERVEAELIYNGYTYPLVIQKNDERNFDTSCTWGNQAPLCEHKTLFPSASECFTVRIILTVYETGTKKRTSCCKCTGTACKTT